ncbi:hypothetical protein GPECTOR_8g351 [Gonium pectorale]|uniref:Uncharacterized protein n=1 Tax=Gonium pectorale TaxID=33097 RepID=A0A150GUH6_GONPE|nr:hypothetical protein GPECTOR_8g351 [Gonium pectorale]|eukprot:KXZ52980.1 hypothetical protein GPECTOR_8g351 [Gonium pectorale]
MRRRGRADGSPGAIGPLSTSQRDVLETDCFGTPRLPPAALALALRTLVNLTSNPRAAGPVRQAILRDDDAVAAVLQLLSVADLGMELQASDSDNVDQSSGLGWAAPSDDQDADGGAAADSEAVEAARWQLAGLAAWLLAHLCSAPSGQLQLVQEGVVSHLVRLVRQARLAWAASEAAAADANGSDAAGEATEARVGAGLGLLLRSAAGSSSSSAALLSAAAVGGAASGARAAGGALPYTIAAMQYALMALVNVTYDNSANQRLAALGGVLEELDCLFAALLQPGVLQDEVATHAAAATGVDPQVGAAPTVGATAETAAEQEARSLRREPGAAKARAQLLRGCCTGVAKFAVWLLAHISSSDPDLKAAIAGPAFGFVPKLLAFLLTQPQPAAAATVPVAVSPGVVVVQQYAAMALVNLTCGVPATKATVAGAIDWAALVGLLGWLAAEHGQSPLPVEGVAAQEREERAALLQVPPCVTSELLLYTVWLLQHLSLSPLAAAAADPRVVPPLVALLHASDPHVRLRCAAALGEGDAGAVAAAVGGGALELLEALLSVPHAACLIPAAEALQALARAARAGSGSAHGCASDVAAAAADHVPRGLLSRVVAVMLTHGDPRVRTAMNEALGAITALPGVRDRYGAVFAETLRELVSSAEVELQVIRVS